MWKNSAWVLIPSGRVNGRAVQTLLQSLATQIKARHADKQVKSMRIDSKTRKIIVEFREG
ncbi:hypothetical protein [Polycladomyces subterraneus]|uniref:Uncharacterized protein n=1 Tax=Polycladomyces subterraneus TaxID=1016997 RepID=A0ABT8IK74_9BACL|nr:hypothetical protein [Polycladomyces subterraneus]MDN4593195.1 hypothetical protein [Polycladomyces subterraneus]